MAARREEDGEKTVLWNVSLFTRFWWSWVPKFSSRFYAQGSRNDQPPAPDEKPQGSVLRTAESNKCADIMARAGVVGVLEAVH